MIRARTGNSCVQTLHIGVWRVHRVNMIAGVWRDGRHVLYRAVCPGTLGGFMTLRKHCE